MRAHLAAVLVIGACGNPNAGTDDAPTGDDGPAVGGGDAGDGYKLLVERDWELDANRDDYQCRRVRINEDMYVVGFRAEVPAGTHHAMVTMTPTTKLIGTYHCDVLENETTLVYAGGVGVEDVTLPPGVAFKIPAGSYVNLNLHLDNETAAMATGKSGLYVKTVPAAMVEHEADSVFLGNTGSTKNIAAATANGPTTTTIFGETQPPHDWHIVALIPHMHHVGVKLKVDELAADLTPIATRLDANYDLNVQHRYAMDFLVPQNHRLITTCTYVNATAQVKNIGDSIWAEQCLTTMYRWPKETDVFADKYSSVTKSPN